MVRKSELMTNVVFLIEGTAINGAYLNDMKNSYIIPTLEYFSQMGSIDERDTYSSDTNQFLYGAIMYKTAQSLPGVACTSYGPFTNPQKILNVLDKLDVSNGKCESNAYLAEGMATALICFDDMNELRDGRYPVQNHCILICNSAPYTMPVTENALYENKTVEQMAVIFREKNVNLSILSARKIPILFKIFEKADGNMSLLMNRNYASDPRHLILLKGYSLKEQPVSPAHKSVQNVSAASSINAPSPQSNNNQTSNMANVDTRVTNKQQNTLMRQNSGNNLVRNQMNPQEQRLLHQQQPQQLEQQHSQLQQNSQLQQQVRNTIQQQQMLNTMQQQQGYSGQQISKPNINNNAMQQQQMNQWTAQQQQQQQQQQKGSFPSQNPMHTSLPQVSPSSAQPNNQHQDVPNKQSLQQSMRMQIQQQKAQAEQLQHPIKTEIQEPGKQQFGMQAGFSGHQPQPNIQPQSIVAPRERIWSGMIEWMEKSKSNQTKMTRQVPCSVLANVKDGEPEIKAHSWPATLRMQLMPKQLIGNIGGSFLKESKTVVFNPHACEALDALIHMMSAGFAGCIHFNANATTNCAINVLILLYAPDKRAFWGFVPINQAGFVDGLRQVIQQKQVLKQTGAIDNQAMQRNLQQQQQQQLTPNPALNMNSVGGGSSGQMLTQMQGQMQPSQMQPSQMQLQMSSQQDFKMTMLHQQRTATKQQQQLRIPGNVNTGMNPQANQFMIAQRNIRPVMTNNNNPGLRNLLQQQQQVPMSISNVINPNSGIQNAGMQSSQNLNMQNQGNQNISMQNATNQNRLPFNNSNFDKNF